MKLSSFIKINPADSVVVCLRPMQKGEVIEVDGKSITLLQDTPAGHKVLIDDAAEGQNIIKYGYPIGHAKQNLKQGEWVNENNLKTNLAGTLEYTYNPVDEQLVGKLVKNTNGKRPWKKPVPPRNFNVLSPNTSYTKPIRGETVKELFGHLPESM